MKVSVIDLGFNSVKLVNYDVDSSGAFRAYRQEGVKVRLGEGMQDTGLIRHAAISRTTEALRLFKDMIKFDSIKHVLPVATSAVREARNKIEFLKQVKNETGLSFTVLSEKEEALYSYIGALQSICLPTALFFDIGGGSLELVYIENYSIKQIRSYPLGALRLTQMFRKSDGSYSKKSYNKMWRHVTEMLPSLDQLDLNPDTALVGVGGALRAIARYDQEVIGYELDKIHNYRMSFSDVSSLTRELSRMDSEEIQSIKAIGNNRTETIVAGSTVITLLMKKLGFDKIVVSAQGLREGVLSTYISDPKLLLEDSISLKRAKSFVTKACRPEILPARTQNIIEPLLAAGLFREREKTILTHAIKELETLPAAANLNNLFYMIIDEDNRFLTHREQLILALSIIYTRKGKTADWIFSRYKKILEPQNRRSIEKIAACLSLSSLIEQAQLQASISIGKAKRIDMKIIRATGVFIPQMLLSSAVKNFGQAFNIPVSLHVIAAKSVPGAKIKEKLSA